jgi:hypothetical protein
LLDLQVDAEMVDGVRIVVADEDAVPPARWLACGLIFVVVFVTMRR